MNPLNEPYSDLIGDQDDPALLRCVADLDATCAVFALSPERDAALAHNLATQARVQTQHLSETHTSTPRWLRLPWQTGRWRLASLALAALLAASGVGAYLHGQAPTPVNAQTVLHRAAAVSPGPNEASHATYRLSASGGYTGTGEVWVGADASGAPIEFAVTQTMSKDGSPAPELSSRSVRTKQSVQVYDPAHNTVTVYSSGGRDQEAEGLFVGTLVAQKLSRAIEVQRRQVPFKLEQQTLDGVSVYTLKLDYPDSQTFYFNTQSYVLEGADWVQGGRSFQARLAADGYHTMALASVPANTFTLNAPATARVVTHSSPPEAQSKASADDRIIRPMAAACNTTPQALHAALQAGNRSMLAICRQTNPGITVDRLVTALMAPFKSDLDAKVASGALTAAEEASDLAKLRQKLTFMVTGQPGAGSKPATK